MKNRIIYLQDIGLTDYQEAFELQTGLFENLKQIKIDNKHNSVQKTTDNYFLFTEHPHVYTLGKSGKKEHLLLSDDEMLDKKVQFIPTNRGGDITYHGPGQIVGYPIIDLDNFGLEIMSYMRKLEAVIIKVLAHYHIKGERSEGETGVWLDVGKPTARKICAMGVKTSRWVTMHGFALNIDVDLDYFNHIIPCGIKNKGVTSLQNELQTKVDKEEVKQLIIKYFEQEFEANIKKDATLQ
jgi:lipoyl(octanoyl) transferase